MLRRDHVATLLSAGVIALQSTVLAQVSPSFVTPTTTTTTTTTTAPEIVTPTTTTTPPVIVTPTTTTTPLVIVSPSAATAPPEVVAPTSTTGFDDVVQATVVPDGDRSDIPLGVIDTSGAVPEDLDLTAFPVAPGAPTAAAIRRRYRISEMSGVGRSYRTITPAVRLLCRSRSAAARSEHESVPGGR